MTRKILVAAIALIYMVLGLLSFCNSWTPSSSELFVISLFPFVGGVLAIYAGLAMFRVSEFGRKLVVILLSLRVVINILLLLGWLKEGAGLAIKNSIGEIIYRIESPYAYQGFVLVWIIVGLLTILFLSQRETKAIFVSETINEVEPDIIFE
jgi:hypothetical protein